MFHDSFLLFEMSPHRLLFVNFENGKEYKYILDMFIYTENYNESHRHTKKNNIQRKAQQQHKNICPILISPLSLFVKNVWGSYLSKIRCPKQKPAFYVGFDSIDNIVQGQSF